MTDEQLLKIEERANQFTEFHSLGYWTKVVGEDFPALIAEIRRLSLYEQEFREAVQASMNLFQGADAPYNHLLQPGDRITVKGWAALDREIRLLKSTINAMLEWDSAHNSTEPPDSLNTEREP